MKHVNGAIDRFAKDGLVVCGKTVEADVVIVATGFEPDYQKSLEPVLGPVPMTLPLLWGLDREGDLRGVMEEPGEFPHPRQDFADNSVLGLWLLIGAAAHARFHSPFIALQIKSRCFGVIRGCDSSL